MYVAFPVLHCLLQTLSTKEFKILSRTFKAKKRKSWFKTYNIAFS